VVGAAHHFHTKNPESPERCVVDDTSAQNISWPNYHSGNNGDLQSVVAVGPLHEVLTRADGSAVRDFPARPHEGAVSAPSGESARVIASGNSKVTGRAFNLIVAFEGTASRQGRALAHASFHDFADYNWDPSTDARPSSPIRSASSSAGRLSGWPTSRPTPRTRRKWLARR
jgi:hypothetical protein